MRPREITDCDFAPEPLLLPAVREWIINKLATDTATTAKGYGPCDVFEFVWTNEVHHYDGCRRTEDSLLLSEYAYILCRNRDWEYEEYPPGVSGPDEEFADRDAFIAWVTTKAVAERLKPDPASVL